MVFSRLRAVTRQKPALAGALPDYSITNSSDRLAQDGNRRVDVAVRVVVDHGGAHPSCRVDEDELDLLRFEKLCRQGRAAQEDRAWLCAADRFAEALDLWRGAALADVPSELLRERELPRLERLRLYAAEERVDAEIRLDRHRDALLQLHELIGQDPLCEHLRAQLMLVLLWCGRRAEALASHRDARRVLIDELGIEPGPELRGLHARILAGEDDGCGRQLML